MIIYHNEKYLIAQLNIYGKIGGNSSVTSVSGQWSRRGSIEPPWL